MSILNLMSDDLTELSEEEIHLWEDLIPVIRDLDNTQLELKPDIALYETSIRSFLLDKDIPPKLVYPIMRANGYTSGMEVVSNDKVLVIPVITELEDLYDEIRLKMGI